MVTQMIFHWVVVTFDSSGFVVVAGGGGGLFVCLTL